MNRTILFSGGMDSVALWLRYPAAKLIYVRIGAPYEEREIESMLQRGLIGRVQMIGGGRWLGQRADSMGRVPLRNLFFAVAAAAATDCDEVLLGATAGETSPDKSRHFARMASEAMAAAEGRPIRLAMPFRGITKRQLVRRLLRRDNPQGPQAMATMLRSCPSCYASDLPAGVAGCGRCMSCVRRWAAFSLNGIHEEYETPPWEYAQALRAKGGKMKFLRRTPVRDWWGVAKLNAELLHALSKAPRRRVMA